MFVAYSFFGLGFWVTVTVFLEFFFVFLLRYRQPMNKVTCSKFEKFPIIVLNRILRFFAVYFIIFCKQALNSLLLASIKVKRPRCQLTQFQSRKRPLIKALEGWGQGKPVARAFAPDMRRS